jgi:hypothetical protein
MTDNPQGKKSVGQEELDDSKEVIRFRKSKNSMYLITALYLVVNTVVLNIL